MRFWLAGLAALGWAVYAAPATAGGDGPIHELRLGILAHDVDGLWSGFRLEDGVDFNIEALLRPSLAFLGGTLRPALGASVNSNGDTSKAYLDARVEWGGATGLFLGTGIGGTIHDGKLGPTSPNRKALGSRVLFHIPAEVGYRFSNENSLSVYFDHMSNGYLASSNEGLDTLGLRYGRRF